MKGKFLLGSTLLALALTPSAFASNYTQTSTARTTHQELSPTGTIEIAQRYITAQYVSSRLYNSEPQILSVAGEVSGSKVRWRSVNVEIMSADRVKLNLVGKVPVGGRLLKDSNIRVGLFLNRDRQGNFRVVDDDFDVWGGSVPGRVRKEAERRLRDLPNYYSRFQEVLNSILA